MISLGFVMCCITALSALLEPTDNTYSENSKAILGFIGIFGFVFICIGVAIWLWGNLP